MQNRQSGIFDLCRIILILESVRKLMDLPVGRFGLFASSLMNLIQQMFQQFRQIIVIDLYILDMRHLQLDLTDRNLLFFGDMLLEFIRQDGRKHRFLFTGQTELPDELIRIIVVKACGLAGSLFRIVLLELRHSGIILAQQVEHSFPLFFRRRQLLKFLRELAEFFHRFFDLLEHFRERLGNNTRFHIRLLLFFVG